jgi:hypothetical protein
MDLISLKVLLYCFEWLSGLKFNYHKSRVILFVFDQEEKERKANMLNRRLGDSPVKYLGIPVSDKMLGTVAFRHVSKNVEKIRPLEREIYGIWW